MPKRDRPKLPKVCKQCGKDYLTTEAKSVFCSKACFYDFRRGEQTERTCPGCGVKWLGPVYVKYNYCSRQCFHDHHGYKPYKKDAECEQCGTSFVSVKAYGREYEWTKYCSNECRVESLRTLEGRDCVVCGTTFYPHNCRVNAQTCSVECRDKYFTGEHSGSWHGGTFTDTRGYARKYAPYLNKGSKYEAEHRIVAMSIIKRPLEKGEVITFLDRDKTNCDPDNLFLCYSNGEFCKRRAGVLPWPTHSNLQEIAKKEGRS